MAPPKRRDPRDNLPPAGVSGITPMGGREQVASKAEATRGIRRPASPASAHKLTPAELARQRAAGRQRGPGEDMLTESALSQGRRSGNAGPVPPGTTRIQQDVVEIPIRTRRKSNRGIAVWDSIDGNTYQFKFIGDDGKIDKNRVFISLYCAIRELRLGGDPLTVIAAFRVKFDDDNGLPVFPISDIEIPPIEHLFSPQSAPPTRKAVEDDGWGQGIFADVGLAASDTEEADEVGDPLDEASEEDQAEVSRRFSLDG